MKIEAAHRKHLKHILRIYWPKTITCAEIYRRTNSYSIRKDIITARWRYFRTTLLAYPLTPASLAMKQYFKPEGPIPPQRGKPHNLPTLLYNDLQLVDITLKTYKDYIELKRLAKDPDEWDLITSDIIATTMENAATAAEVKRSKRKERERRRKEDIDTNKDVRPKRHKPEQEGEAVDPQQTLHQRLIPTATNNGPATVPQDTDRFRHRKHSKRKSTTDAISTLEAPAAKRRARRQELVDSLGSIERNSRRVISSNMYLSSDNGRDL